METGGWFDQSPLAAQETAVSMGLPGFRGRQIWRWIHREHVFSYDAMTDLPRELRWTLAERMPLPLIKTVRQQRSAGDGTVKYLFELSDGHRIESVLMRYRFGCTVCVSSQVGCRMGCRFCASALSGFVRNLTPGEMLQQIYHIEREENVRVTHAVVMGCGEPFDNYENLLRFLNLLHEPEGQGMSYRSMTVSTCGLPGPLADWIREKKPVTLAVSLHAPNDAVRKRLMPIAETVSMKELLRVCEDYTRALNKRVTFEYALIKGINDSPQQARELAGTLSGLLCHVNLIPVNPVPERGLKRPPEGTVREFTKILNGEGIPATVRRELGRDIDGACGQLRRRYHKEVEGTQ